MRRYLLDTNMAGHFIDKRQGVDERVRDAKAAALASAFPCLVNSIMASSSARRAIRIYKSCE
jgi:hypothetical protein